MPSVLGKFQSPILRRSLEWSIFVTVLYVLSKNELFEVVRSCSTCFWLHLTLMLNNHAECLLTVKKWSEFLWMRLHFHACMHAVAKSCPTLRDSIDRSLPASCVPWILQARILERVSKPSSGRSSWPRDGTCLLRLLNCRQILYPWATGKLQVCVDFSKFK